MDTKPSDGDVKRTRRRRSSGERSGRGLTTASSFLQHQGVSKFAPLVMAGAAALYVAISGYWIYSAVGSTGGLWRGMTKTDTRYISGAPTVEGADQWIYSKGETTVTLNYNDRGQSDAILCSTAGANGGACAPFLGIGVNTTEDAIWTALGAPDFQKYYGDTKVIAYSGLGVQFTLERFAVKGIGLVPITRPELTLFQSARAMLP